MLAQIPAVASKTIRVPVLMPLYGRKDYKAEKRRARGRDNGEREEKREITVTLRANKGGGRRGGMRFWWRTGRGWVQGSWDGAHSGE